MQKAKRLVLLLLVVVILVGLLPSHVKAADNEMKRGIVSLNYLSDLGILLKLREQPNTKCKILDTLAEGEEVIIHDEILTSNKSHPKWYKVTVAKTGKEGYVAATYIVLIRDEIKYESECESDFYIVANANKVNIRSGPGTNHEKLGKLKRDTIIYVEEVIKTSDVNGPWLKFKYGTDFAYISSRYAKKETEKSNLYGVVVNVRNAVNVREHPTTASRRITTLSKGTEVIVCGSRNTSDSYKKWYNIRVGNIEGWIVTNYLEVGQWALVSTVTTSTSAPNPNRDHNIQLAGSRLTGEIVIPGETFSWLEKMGQCSKEKGFLESTIYVGGRNELGYGGGVCQVTTTMNMTVKQLGIKTNAIKHGRPVSYADREDEATVSYPNLDFSFKNTLHNSLKLEFEGCCTCNLYQLIPVQWSLFE